MYNNGLVGKTNNTCQQQLGNIVLIFHFSGMENEGGYLRVKSHLKGRIKGSLKMILIGTTLILGSERVLVKKNLFEYILV